MFTLYVGWSPENLFGDPISGPWTPEGITSVFEEARARFQAAAPFRPPGAARIYLHTVEPPRSQWPNRNESL